MRVSFGLRLSICILPLFLSFICFNAFIQASFKKQPLRATSGPQNSQIKPTLKLNLFESRVKILNDREEKLLRRISADIGKYPKVALENMDPRRPLNPASAYVSEDGGTLLFYAEFYTFPEGVKLFIISHEMGHIYYGHQGEATARQQIMADSFALRYVEPETSIKFLNSCGDGEEKRARLENANRHLAFKALFPRGFYF